MSETSGTHAQNEKTQNVLAAKPQPLGAAQRGREDNIKMDLRGIT
jgi:hypothetical protein